MVPELRKKIQSSLEALKAIVVRLFCRLDGNYIMLTNRKKASMMRTTRPPRLESPKPSSSSSPTRTAFAWMYLYMYKCNRCRYGPLSTASQLPRGLRGSGPRKTNKPHNSHQRWADLPVSFSNCESACCHSSSSVRGRSRDVASSARSSISSLSYSSLRSIQRSWMSTSPPA